MKFGKFKFASSKEFKTVIELAFKHGFKTNEEFEKFLKNNYNHLKI